MALFIITGRDIARIADSPAVIERGLAAFERGSVVSLQALGRTAIIHVEDGGWVRTVEVRFDGAGRPASAGCDCPGDTAGCEHVVAALCALEHEYGGERPAGGTTAGRLPESGQEKGRMGEGLTFEQIERAVPGEALVRAFDLIRAPRRLAVHHFDDQVVRASVDAGDGTRETVEISDITRRYGGYGSYGYGAGLAGSAAGRAVSVSSDPYYVEQHLEFTCTCRGGYMELPCPHVAAVLLAAVMRESDRPSLVDHEKRLRKEVNLKRLGSICRELDCAVAEDSSGALLKGLGKADGKGKTKKHRFFFSIEDAHDGGGRVMLLVEKAVVRKDRSLGKVTPATEKYLRRFYDGFSDVEKRAIDMLAETQDPGGGGNFRDTSKQMVKVGFSTAVDMELLGRLKELYRRDPGWFPDCSFPDGCGEFLTRVEEKGGGGGGRFALRFFLRLGERAFALDGRSCRVFGERRLWAIAADGEEAGRLLFEVACPRAGAALNLAQRSGTEMDAETLRHFVEAYYLKLARLGRVELPEGFDVAELRAEPRPRLYLRDYASVFSIELRFLYGKREISAAEPGDIVLRGEGEMITRIRRDAGAEAKFLALLLGCSVEERGGVLLPSGDPCAWLADAAPELIRGGFEIFGRDTLCNQRVRTGSPFLNIQVRA
ncbi:MAG: SWIM zinc finger family protein, partial [Pseudomonadota bacterium]